MFPQERKDTVGPEVFQSPLHKLNLSARISGCESHVLVTTKIKMDSRSHLQHCPLGLWSASPKGIGVSSSALEEQDCKREVNEEPSRVVRHRRPARASREPVCSGVHAAQ